MATAAIRPPIEAEGRIFTAADLAEMPRELPSGPVRYELDNGRLIAMSPPGFAHGSVEARIAAALFVAGERAGLGQVCSGETGVVLWRNPDRVVGVDVAFVAAASLPARLSDEGYLETIPELVVEVLSPNDTKPYLERKVDDYLRSGVRVVWLADPKTQTLTEYRRGDPPRVLSLADTATLPDLIPSLNLLLKDIFAA